MEGIILLIVMKSSKYKVIDIRRKTQAQMFKNIKPVDLLQFSIPIEYAGSNRGNTYASYVKEEIRKTVDKIIEKYVDKSTEICEKCSKPGELVKDYYLSIMCNDCKDIK